MSTGTESRLPEVVPGARAGRRWRRWSLVAGAVVVVALVAAVTYLNRFQPLADGSLSGVEGAELAADYDGAPYAIPYRDRTLVRALLSLRNDGRFPVRVERVGAQQVIEGGEWHGLVDFRPDRNGLTPVTSAAYDAPAFRPFTLAPDEERAVSVALWLDNCEHNGPGTTATITEAPVEFRVFGLTRTQWVEIEHPWAVTAPAAACPRPRPAAP